MDLIVASKGEAWQAAWNGRRFGCAVGRGGIVAAAAKREGDGASPAGAWPLRRLFARPDRQAPPATRLPVTWIDPKLGWCDAPADPAYNRPVRLPHPSSHERLWRGDHLYDWVVELGYNDAPPIPGKGSAIFLHLARRGFAPTEGCLALSRRALAQVLAEAGPESRVVFTLPEA